MTDPLSIDSFRLRFCCSLSSLISENFVFVFYSWWQYSENLATYEQQDAHEFFISILDRIHEKEGKLDHVIRGNQSPDFSFPSP